MDDKNRLAQLEELIVVMLQRQEKLETLISDLQAERRLVEQRLCKLESYVEAQLRVKPAADWLALPTDTPQTLLDLLTDFQRRGHIN